MKVLLSSTACRPFGGSEGIYGWRACRAIADLHDVWILTSADNRNQIEEAHSKGMVPDSMNFVYIDCGEACHPNRLIARLQSWRNYQRFQKETLEVSRKLHREIGFDLAQLVTYTTWRVGSPLWKLEIPFIWGPISGTEEFPIRFLPCLSATSMAFEFIRIASGCLARINPRVFRCAKNSTHIVAIHNQAAEFLIRLRGKPQGVSVFPAFFFDEAHIRTLCQTREYNLGGAPLQMIASGNLEGRKGVAIALHALAEAKKAGVSFHYRVTSSGPELKHLERLVVRLGLEDNVDLGTPFPFGEYADRLREFDICLLPSLREGGGLTMMESMLAGCVPIVANLGGPGDSVNNECGFPVEVTCSREMIHEIARILIILDRDRDQLRCKGENARKRMLSRATEVQFKEQINTLYDMVKTHDSSRPETG